MKPYGVQGLTWWRRAAAVALLLAALSAIALSDALHDALLGLFAIVEQAVRARPVAGVILFLIGAALSALLAFFSSAVLVPIAITTWGKPISMLLLWIGWTVGGIVAYNIGRHLGRPMARWLTSEETLDRFTTRISSRAPFGLVLLFQIALPSEVPGYVLGLLRYPMGKYLLALGLTELPISVGTVYLGATFLERNIFMLVGIGIAGALFSGWALYTLQKRLADRPGS
jgi:uncharacterized membrane protein YdjX (TVP38/TMEM64 family)